MKFVYLNYYAYLCSMNEKDKESVQLNNISKGQLLYTETKLTKNKWLILFHSQDGVCINCWACYNMTTKTLYKCKENEESTVFGYISDIGLIKLATSNQCRIFEKVLKRNERRMR